MSWGSAHAQSSWRQRAGALGGGTAASVRGRRIRVLTAAWGMGAMIRSEPRRHQGRSQGLARLRRRSASARFPPPTQWRKTGRHSNHPNRTVDARGHAGPAPAAPCCVSPSPCCAGQAPQLSPTGRPEALALGHPCAAAAGDRAGAEAAASAVREEWLPAAACGREAWRTGRLYFLSVNAVCNAYPLDRRYDVR